MRTSVYTRTRQSSYEDSKAQCLVELLLQSCSKTWRGVGGGGGGQLCLGKSVRHGGTIFPRARGIFIPRHQCPGGQSCLGMNVRGDTFFRGTAMPPTPPYIYL